jgi:CYTH domain-containing protein/thymidylate kinase
MKNLTFKLTPLSEIEDGITKIVITGGPCAGKTTGLARLVEALQNRDYKVLVTTESATKLIMSGVRPWELPIEMFQKHVLFDSLLQEESILQAARNHRESGHKVVILCDRGGMDGQAYVGEDVFQTIVTDMGLDFNDICNNRYHGVIHLTTAADGAEDFYTLENNSARKETVEEARLLDGKTLRAWQRHQHVRVIDNSTDFNQKITRMIAEVCSILGDPEPIEVESRFLIGDFDPENFPVELTCSSIEQDYLVSGKEGEVRRVRSRGDKHGSTYFYTIKKYISPGVRGEVERIITERQYNELMNDRDRAHRTIKKRRYCFFYEKQFIEVDVFKGLDGISGESGKPLVIMEIEQSGVARELKLPPFVRVIREVTTDEDYSNYALSRIG